MVCANCGAVMEERACHVTCRRCGYFEDCSDGMLPVLNAKRPQPEGARPSEVPPVFLTKPGKSSR